jgi:hypothetical protein
MVGWGTPPGLLLLLLLLAAVVVAVALQGMKRLWLSHPRLTTRYEEWVGGSLSMVEGGVSCCDDVMRLCCHVVLFV